MRRENEMRDDGNGGDDWKARKEGPSGKLIGAAIAGALLLVFVLQNTSSAEVNFLFWDGATPLWVLIVVSATLGLVIGWFLGRGSGRRAAIRKLKD